MLRRLEREAVRREMGRRGTRKQSQALRNEMPFKRGDDRKGGWRERRGSDRERIRLFLTGRFLQSNFLFLSVDGDTVFKDYAKPARTSHFTGDSNQSGLPGWMVGHNNLEHVQKRSKAESIDGVPNGIWLLTASQISAFHCWRWMQRRRERLRDEKSFDN